MKKQIHPVQPRKVNLGNSTFTMRANLKTQELVWQQFWHDINLLDQIQQPNQPIFVLHSGPPYANGNLHIGHALNIILKDFTLRFYRALNYRVNYLPGWDTHGLPIANAVIKNRNIQPAHLQYRQACYKYALAQVERQKRQFQRLGLLIDWQKNYLTCSNDYLAAQMQVFSQLIKKQLLVYDLRPVFWSWSSQTALAETEIEYRLYTSQAVYVKFPLTANAPFAQTSLLIWTTTPWTLVANQFLAVNPALNYVRFAYQNQYLIVAEPCWKTLAAKFNWLTTEHQLIAGTDLINLSYRHCYLQQTSVVIPSSSVEATTGTGIVHIAPAFGPDDFELVKPLQTTVTVPLDERGVFTAACADSTLVNQFYQTAQTKIIAQIKQQANLLLIEPYSHQYPHDWRTHQPVIYRATNQLFINLKPLWPTIKRQIAQIKWQPTWGQKRLFNLLEQRRLWCLSRQRKWGTPLPLFFNQSGQPVLAVELVDWIQKLLAIHGDQIWWDWPITKLISAELRQKYQIVSKSSDTMDVWFDAGCSLQAIFPNQTVDLIWEGTDQFRGWFNSLIIVNAIMERTQPLIKIATHGFVNDQHGLKMSKSKGNIIDPQLICQQFGADVLRVWVASTNFYDDVSLGQTNLTQSAQTYRKLRNTFRFILNNLVDFKPAVHQQTSFTAVDEWILFQANVGLERLLLHFRQLNFHVGFKLLVDFVTNKLSQFYFELIKDDLYLMPANAVIRRQHQTTLWHLLQQFLPVIAIFLPHTAEEIYQTLPVLKTAPSVHLLPLNLNLVWPPKLKTLTQKLIFALKWHYRCQVRDFLFKELEKAQFAGIIPRRRHAILTVDLNPAYQLFQNNKQVEKFARNWNLAVKWDYQTLNQKFSTQKLYIYSNWTSFCFVKKVNCRITNQKIDQLGQVKVALFDGQACQRCRQIYPKLVVNFCQNCLNI